MSLVSTSQYYVTVDSQFRDQEKYPLDTDFGVSFQTKNPNLNYPQGLPLDPSQPFPRIAIDKNFDSIGIQVKGGYITEYAVDSGTGDIIFSGVTVRGDDNGNQVARDFLITYNGMILFSLVASIYHITPFICRLSSDYIPKWLIMIKQKPQKTNTTLDSTFKLISNSSVYFMFDYTMFSGLNSNLGRTTDLIYFEKYTYSSFYPNDNTNIVSVKTLNYSFENYYSNYLYSPLYEESKAVIGIFAFDINGNPLYLNGHPWGYHSFSMNTYYYGQIFDILPSNNNGRNVMTVDKGDNLYLGVNINPFNISLNKNNMSTSTPYYLSDINISQKPIAISIQSPYLFEYPPSSPIELNHIQQDNILLYLLSCSSNSIYQTTGANRISLLRIDINNHTFYYNDININLNGNMTSGIFLKNNDVRPLALIGNSNENFSYNTGPLYNISNYYTAYDYGTLSTDNIFYYTGSLSSISSLNYTGTNVSIDYISTLSIYYDLQGIQGLLNAYKYVYTGSGNSSLSLLDSIPVLYNNSPYIPSIYNDYNKSSKVTSWYEGNTPYIAYVLQGDQYTAGTYNTIFINILTSTGSITSPPIDSTTSYNSIINIKQSAITDFQSFTIKTKVFLILVSGNVTYVFKRDYSVSSDWTTITIPNNAQYIIPKIKAVGTTYRIYLVSSNMFFNTSNVYVIPYENGYSYYYQLGSEYRFASGQNAIVSVLDDNIVSLERTINGSEFTSKFNVPRGFTFQDKIVDSQHVYYNNSYVSILPTEYLGTSEVRSIKTLTINGTTYLFTLRYENNPSIANIDIFYMDEFTPIYITNCQLTNTNAEVFDNDLSVYYIPDGTNDIDGIPYGQDRGIGSGCIVIVVPPNISAITSGVKIAIYSVVSSTELLYVDQASVDGGSPVYNSWIYNYNGVYYLVNNITDLSTSSSSFNFYSIDYKYRFSFISNQTFPFGGIYYITAGEIYYNYTDQITGEAGPVLLCYYSKGSSLAGHFSIIALTPSAPNIRIIRLQQLPSPVIGYTQPTYISVDRNRQLNNYGIVSISWSYFTYLINIQDNGTLTLSSEVISGNFSTTQTVSVVWNPVISKILLTVFMLDTLNIVRVYDVTNAGTTSDIVTLSAQINIENVTIYNNYLSTTSYFSLYTALCNQSVILFSSSNISNKSQSVVGGFSGFPSILTYDLSNPSFANLYQTPTKVSNNITTYGNGNALLVKLQNDGQILWNMSLGDSGNYSYASSFYDSQYVNINNISLDSTELNVYSSVNWKTKLAVVDYSSTTPSQSITNPFNSYSAQNSCLLKVKGDIGTSTFLVPIVGGNDTFPIGCNPITTSAFSLGLSAKSSITYIYRNQPAGTLINPSVIQNVVNTLSLENSHVIAIDTSGNLLWSSSIQSTLPTTSITSYYLYTYGGDTFLVCKSNENCYITDSSKTKKQSIIQFPETASQDYILIARFDSNGLYKESDTIETPSTMLINPNFLYSNGSEFSLSTSNYQRNLNFADIWIRNKDGTIGSITTLPEENLYFTRTVYSTPGVYFYNSPTGCIGSVVKLWGAGGDVGLFYLNAGNTGTLGGLGGGASFSKTFIDPSYNKFAIKVGAASKGGKTYGGLIDAVINDGYGSTGTGFGGNGGEASWVVVDASNPTGPIEGNFVFYAIAAGGGGGSYNYDFFGGPGGNYPVVNAGSIGNYGQNGIGGLPIPAPPFANNAGGNCPLKIQTTAPFYYNLTGTFGKGGTGDFGCGGGGDGFGGGAGGNYVFGLTGSYNGGAGGGIYGYTTLVSNYSIAANNTDIDYPSYLYVGEGGNSQHYTGGNGYVVVYSFFYSSTGYTKGQPPAGYSINPTYIDGTVINYKYNPSYTDPNGNTYSKLTCYTSSGTTGSAFLPYHTTAPFYFSSGSTGTDLIGKYVYIKGDPSDTILNNNFSIRESSYNSSTNEYNIVLNSKIDTSQIIRKFQEVNNNNFTKYFYTSNIAQSLTTAILPFGGPTGSIITVTNTYTFDTTKKYYIITPTNKVTNITNISLINSIYYLTVDTPSNLLGNTYITITPFNNSALYTLQFYPGSLATPLYYKVSLQRLTIPNRRVRNSPYTGVRELSDFPYIFLEIYNTSDNDLYDNQIVNTFYSNDPNKDGRAIFTIPITSAGGQSNYLFLSGSGTPKVKFTPGYYNIRFRLVDPYGNIIEFDNTPYKTSDSAFTGGVVDPRLMNVIVDVIFSPA